MARSGRFERPTLCFGGTRSIQLSYERADELLYRETAAIRQAEEFGSALGAFLDLPRQPFDFLGFFDEGQGKHGSGVRFFDLIFEL